MEAALASGVLKVAGDKIGPLIAGEFASIMGVTKDLSELQDLFGDITSWLSAVGDSTIESDPAVRWVKKLKNVAYDIDDLLYEAHLEAEKHKADIDDDKHVMANHVKSKAKSVMFRFKMAHKIKTIKERFAAIVKQRSDFNAIVNNLPVDRSDRRNNNTIGELSILGNVGKSTIRVRDEEKQMIISKLVETNEGENILTVSIVGLGGSGKTTLAKHICDDKKIKEHFQAAIYWVHVSQEFDVQKLIEKLFENISEEKSNLKAQPYMVKEISKKLSGNKFLLVLDDAWHEDPHDWEQFMGFLNNGAPGSRILFTTRSKRVSEAVKCTNPFDLELLQPDDSWKFFQHCLGWAEEAMDSEFIEVGKGIVSKCGGVPLAVKTLAGVLYHEREIKAWQAIRDSSLFRVKDIEDRVMGSLRLSYFHLPDEFKQCFVLCSIFPKGYMIDKEQLIDQWIAHDMITPTDGVGCLDLEYNKCFNSLVQMSFLQDLTEEYDERVTCRMHDLVHDLARSILGDEISLAVPSKTVKSTKRCRYFSLIKQKSNIPLPKHFFEKGRAIYVDEGDFIFGKALKNAKYLRSITVKNVHTKPVLAAVLQIKNLRYIAVSGLTCETFPKAISDIWSLQSLHVTDSRSLCELPKSVGKLQKLRTLNVSWCGKLKSLPDSIGDCHMISRVDLYHCRELTELPNSISGNKNLGVLRLGHTGIVRLPSSITTLGNLKILDLQRCSELVELPEGLGNLKKLQVLNLLSCHKLSGLPAGFGHLTRLQKLELFVVGEGENFAKISELGNADGIGGQLTISNIVFVKDPGDVAKPCLKKKTNLQYLNLEWGKRIPDLTAENRSIDVLVLDALEPPSGIESICVDGYPGGQCTRWMLKQVGVGEDHPRFPCLTMVYLKDFPNLKHLEGLAEFPSLQGLYLSNMPALESISGGPFPSLVRLYINGCLTLTSWPEGIQGLTALRELYIHECPALTSLPEGIQGLTALKKLYIKECPTLTSLPEGIQGLAALQELHIHRCPALTSMPEGIQGLTALQQLYIEECSALTSLPEGIQGLTALQELHISRCPALTSMPEGIQGLTALQELHISGCPALTSMLEGIQGLIALKKLYIVGCPNLTSMPEGIQGLTALKKLYINGCSSLTSMPEGIQGLTALKGLYISGCLSLTSLPEGIQGLTALQGLHIHRCPALTSMPEGIQSLTALKELYISGCPSLTSMPEGVQGLTALKELNISGCPSLTSWPEGIQGLTALKDLRISGCPSLTSLPEGMKGLTCVWMNGSRLR